MRRTWKSLMAPGPCILLSMQEQADRQSKGPGIRLRGAAPADRPDVFREVYDTGLREFLQERGRDIRALEMGTNRKFSNYVRGIVGHGKTVLEIGCGFGSTALQVAGEDNQIVGVDTAPIAVEVATLQLLQRLHLRGPAAAQRQYPNYRGYVRAYLPGHPREGGSLGIHQPPLPGGRGG